VCREYYEIFKNEKKPICIKIFIHSLKYINIYIFNILHLDPSLVRTDHSYEPPDTTDPTLTQRANMNLDCVSTH
jgi:hypothetical protein